MLSLHLGQTGRGVPAGARHGSRRDFLQMLRQLGADRGVSYCQFDGQAREIRDVQRVYLRCRYDQWVEAFGEPETVSPGFDAAAGTIIRTWQHRCVDGPVTCVGHLFEQPTGVRWVIVVRVCSF
jgi:hypothetical protein